MEVCGFKSSLDSQVERQYRLTIINHTCLSPYLLYTRVVCSNKAFAVMWSLDSAIAVPLDTACVVLFRGHKTSSACFDLSILSSIH